MLPGGRGRGRVPGEGPARQVGHEPGEDDKDSVAWMRPCAPHGRYLRQLALLPEGGRVDSVQDVVGLLHAIHYYCVFCFLELLEINRPLTTRWCSRVFPLPCFKMFPSKQRNPPRTRPTRLINCTKLLRLIILAESSRTMTLDEPTRLTSTENPLSCTSTPTLPGPCTEAIQETLLLSLGMLHATLKREMIWTLRPLLRVGCHSAATAGSPRPCRASETLLSGP